MEKIYTCKYCGKNFDNPSKLGGHTIHCKSNPNRVTKCNFVEYNKKKILKREYSQCNCKFCNKEYFLLDSLKQHELRCCKNPNRIISGIEKYNESNHVVWNKGLSKEISESVAKQSQTLKERYVNKELIPSNLGRKHTDEEKRQISESRRKYLDEHPEKVPFLLNHSSKMSYPEKYFQELFLKENINLEYHVQVKRYELDFANVEQKKYVEIDGEQHYLPYMIEHDRIRTEFLSELGWEGIRIRWTEYQKMSFIEKEEVVRELKKFIY